MNLRLLCLVACCLAAARLSIADEGDEFFEKSIRPVLAKRCFKCHGPETQEAELRLDSREALLRGGQSGKVVVPGDPDASRMVIVLRYDADIQMPPEGKLPAKELEAFIRWIKIGVPWPETKSTSNEQPAAGAKSSPSRDLMQEASHARATHWAFQRVRLPAIPPVRNAKWPRTPIDHFILERLQQAEIAPSPPADARTFIRRATFDLTGLPPTPEEVEEFEQASLRTPHSAIRNLVDRLLASPQYGERWGRHWLDIARYSDTKGYVFTEEKRYPYAYTYRDYVIRSLNEDLPFDQFVLEQLAADQLPRRDEGQSLAAMGFLTVGRRFSNNVADIIDDRIDVVSRGLLGLTVACARCHDHKYDAIPTADYYSLYGVFASSLEPKELPLIGKPAEGEAFQKFREELAKQEGALNEYLTKERGELLQEFRSRAGDYLAQLVIDKLDKTSKQDPYLSQSRGEPRPQMVRKWREFVARAGKSDPVFGLWQELVAVPPDQFSERIRSACSRLKEGHASGVNPLVQAAFLAQPPEKLLDVVRLYGKLLGEINQQWTVLLEQHSQEKREAPKQLPDAAAEELRQVLYGTASPLALKSEELDGLFDRATRNKAAELRKKVEAFKANSPVAPPRAMVMQDAQHPGNARIFLRGNSRNPGPEVPRQYLAVLAGQDRQPFKQGSGRLELAQRIVDPANPLTARVIVNRVWQYHFGQGLVRTPSDFGIRSEPPTHPELLDYLAASFVEQGWSLKKLHRQIMLSAVYQQQSSERSDAAAKDADNRLWWRTNRRRLEFEAARDAMLAVSGSLDLTPGGQPVDLARGSTRRTVYGLVDRQELPDMFRVFDFASPDTSTESRTRTTVPQQALFVMNSPLVLEQARRLASREEIVSPSDPEARVHALYRAVFAREPQPEELQLAVRFLSTQKPLAGAASGSSMNPLAMLAQVLLETNEFMFVD